MSLPTAVPIVTQSEVASGLRRLGLGPGDSLVVHSSLKSFGRVEGGPQAVIAALMEMITSAGTLLMPSFNHGTAFEEGAPGYYHPQETPTINGAIPDAFWRLEGVSRSLDPTHPIAAWGRHSREWTVHHHRTLTMGPQSPLGLLMAEGGYGLLLGVDYHANTFHHVVEMTTGAPCLGQRTEAYPVILPGGRRVTGRTWGWRESGCPINDAATYSEEMGARGLHRQIMIGNCRATLYRLKDGFEVISTLLRQGKGGYPPCALCPIRPRAVPQTVPSDWDTAAGQPISTSEAWMY